FDFESFSISPPNCSAATLGSFPNSRRYSRVRSPRRLITLSDSAPSSLMRANSSLIPCVYRSADWAQPAQNLTIEVIAASWTRAASTVRSRNCLVCSEDVPDCSEEFLDAIGCTFLRINRLPADYYTPQLTARQST